MTQHLTRVALVFMMAVAPLAAQDSPDAAIIGGPSTYVVKAGDTLTGIAARHAVARDDIVGATSLTRPRTLVAGQVLSFDNSHIATGDPGVTITINVPQRLLFLRQGQRVVAYPVAVGTRAWPTPLGEFTIVDKETDPVWDVPVAIQREMAQLGKPVITRMEPSPENPLGAHWLRLSFPGIGIHGTNAPESIYQFASHGCIRMHPDDVAALFSRVPVGTRGVIVYEPIVMALVDGRVWLEAHPDEYGLAPDRELYVRAVADHHGLVDAIDWPAVARVLQTLAGRAEDVTKRE